MAFSKRDSLRKVFLRIHLVRLPKKEEILRQLGDLRTGAPFRWMQRRLNAQYTDFIGEYVELGHMVPVDTIKNTTYLRLFNLPHQAVNKPSSTTSKYRVLFDESSKPSTGISLNKALRPIVQDSIVQRFHLNEIAIMADITKMYRQIRVYPDDHRLQRIFWKG